MSFLHHVRRPIRPTIGDLRAWSEATRATKLLDSFKIPAGRRRLRPHLPWDFSEQHNTRRVLQLPLCVYDFGLLIHKPLSECSQLRTTSTAGNNPALASRLRLELEPRFGPEYLSWVKELGKLLRRLLSEPELDPEARRRRLHEQASTAGFELFQLSQNGEIA